MKLECSPQISKKKKSIQKSNLIKISPVGAELFHSDRLTDMTKLIVAVRYFANAPKNIMYVITLFMFLWDPISFPIFFQP